MATERPAQTSSFQPGAFFRRGLWLFFALVFLLAGCAGPEPAAVKTSPRPAHLIVINQTDYQWRLAINRASGELVRTIQVLARASQKIDLAGGDYVIEQTMLPAATGPGLNRKISSRLESGKTYRWRLATLLSEPNGNSVIP